MEAGGVKHDLKDIPKWVWIGAAGAGTLLWVLTRGAGTGSTGTVANPATLPLSTDPGTPVSGGSTSSPDYTSMLGQLQSEIAALQTGAGAQSGPGPTQQPTVPSTGITGGQPPVASTPTNFGLLPTTSSPTAQGLSLAQQGIQNQLGVYGGAPVSQSTPYTGAGGGWDSVTQTTYAGGGTVTNLGIAKPRPQSGQIIPPAVQTPVIYKPGTSIPDWQATLAQSYIYPQNYHPGMVQP